MKGHDSRVLDINLHKSLSSLNYPEPNIDKIHKIKTSLKSTSRRSVTTQFEDRSGITIKGKDI